VKRSTWEYIITGQAIVILALLGYAFWRHTVPGLITEMKLGGTSSRAEAATELGSKGPAAAAAIPILKQTMADAENLPALRAADALRKVAGPEPLIEMMRSPDAQLRTRALSALCFPVGTTPQQVAQTLDTFIDGLHDSDSGVRAQAALCLTNMGPAGAKAVPAIREAMGDPDPRVRGNATAALINVGSVDDVIASLSSPDAHIRSQILSNLYRFGADAIPAYIAALDDSDPTIVANAAQNLANFGPRAASAVPALTRTLVHPDAYARAYAVTALERISGADALPAIEPMTRDPDVTVRNWARQAVDRLTHHSP
jgi:HEAT repeat protein